MKNAKKKHIKQLNNKIKHSKKQTQKKCFFTSNKRKKKKKKNFFTSLDPL